MNEDVFPAESADFQLAILVYRRVVEFWFRIWSRFSRYDQSRGWLMSLQKLGSCLCLFFAPSGGIHLKNDSSPWELRRDDASDLDDVLLS